MNVSLIGIQTTLNVGRALLVPNIRTAGNVVTEIPTQKSPLYSNASIPLSSHNSIHLVFFFSERVKSTPHPDTSEKYRDTPPISIGIFWQKYALLWQKMTYTPPICITIRLPFVSRCFCRSIRVGGHWNTPKFLCTYRVHAKGVVLCERACFCLLSAFKRLLYHPPF